MLFRKSELFLKSFVRMIIFILYFKFINPISAIKRHKFLPSTESFQAVTVILSVIINKGANASTSRSNGKIFDLEGVLSKLHWSIIRLLEIRRLREFLVIRSQRRRDLSLLLNSCYKYVY